MGDLKIKWNVQLLDNYSSFISFPRRISPHKISKISNDIQMIPARFDSNCVPIQFKNVLNNILLSCHCLVYGYLTDIPLEIKSLCFDYFIGFDLSLNGLDKLLSVGAAYRYDIKTCIDKKGRHVIKNRLSVKMISSYSNYPNHKEIEDTLVQFALRSLCPMAHSKNELKALLACHHLIASDDYRCESNLFSDIFPSDSLFDYHDYDIYDLVQLLSLGHDNNENFFFSSNITRMIDAKIKQYLNKNRPKQSLLNKALNVILSNKWGKRANDILYLMTKNIEYSEIKLTVINYDPFMSGICELLRSEAHDSIGWKLLNAELKNNQSHKDQTYALLPFIEQKVEELKLTIVSYIK